MVSSCSFGQVFTPPVDLAESDLRAALGSGWSIGVRTLTYRTVGFGSHHWEVVDAAGSRWFVTVDDLRTRRLWADEPLANPHHRLRAALTASRALQASGRDFVVAPLPARDGEPTAGLGETFAVALYPLVRGEEFTWGGFTAPHRRAVLDLLVAVHSAPPEVAAKGRLDDFAIPFRDIVMATIDGSDAGDPRLGPFARPAAELLVADATGVRCGLARYDALVSALRADPPMLVLTHGEPHPGNTMRSNGRWLLIDWDTALVAPVERDLWDLDEGDGSIHAAYTEATGTNLSADRLALYRLRWDLAEVAACLARFHEPHADGADDEETWTILEQTVASLRAQSGVQNQDGP